MREFMKQTKVVEEFIDFLDENEAYKEQYEKELLKWQDTTIAIVSKKNIDTLNSCDRDVVKYLRLMARKERIINLNFPFDYDTFAFTSIIVLDIYSSFLKYFSEKYKKEIVWQMKLCGKLLIRYLKDNEPTMFKEYNIDKEKLKQVLLGDEANFNLSTTIPRRILSNVSDMLPTLVMLKVNKGFSKYYIDIMADQ